MRWSGLFSSAQWEKVAGLGYDCAASRSNHLLGAASRPDCRDAGCDDPLTVLSTAVIIPPMAREGQTGAFLPGADLLARVIKSSRDAVCALATGQRRVGVQTARCVCEWFYARMGFSHHRVGRERPCPREQTHPKPPCERRAFAGRFALVRALSAVGRWEGMEAGQGARGSNVPCASGAGEVVGMRMVPG